MGLDINTVVTMVTGIMSHQFVFPLVIILDLFSKTYAETCKNGLICNRCCGNSCCYEDDDDDYGYYSWNIWNMWYFWFIIIFVLLSCFGGCGYWRRRRALLLQRNATIVTPEQGMPVTAGTQPGPYFQGGYTHTTYGTPGVPPNMGVPPSAMFNGPPAYNEVISKPDQYPQPPKTNLPYPDDGASQQAGVVPSSPYLPGPDGAMPPPYSAMPQAPSNQNQGQSAPYM